MIHRPVATPERREMKQQDIDAFEKICVALEELSDAKNRGRVLAATVIFYGVESEVLNLLGEKS